MTAINDSRDNILTKLQRLQNFDEELVFLVTDSFVLQDRAKGEIASGDREAALASLRESNDGGRSPLLLRTKMGATP